MKTKVITKKKSFHLGKCKTYDIKEDRNNDVEKYLKKRQSSRNSFLSTYSRPTRRYLSHCPTRSKGVTDGPSTNLEDE